MNREQWVTVLRMSLLIVESGPGFLHLQFLDLLMLKQEWSTHLHNIHYINDFVEVSLNKEIEYSRVSISQHSQDQIMRTNLDTWRVFLHHSTVLFSDLSRSYIGKKLDRPCHFSIWSVHQFQSLTDDIIGNQLWSWGEDKYCDVILWGTFVVII